MQYGNRNDIDIHKLCEESVYGTKSQYDRLVSHACKREAQVRVTNHTGNVTKDVCTQHAKAYDKNLGWHHDMAPSARERYVRKHSALTPKTGR